MPDKRPTRLVATLKRALGMTAEERTLYCSFCGKSQHDVRKLIAGPTVHICDECVDLCKEIVDREDTTDGQETADPLQQLAGIATSLGQATDGDRHVKRALSVILKRHCERMAAASDVQEAPPAYGLLIGPTLARSEWARSLQESLPVPFAIVDAPTLAACHDELDTRAAIANHLIVAADLDAERARHGIVYVDDLDQIALLGAAPPGTPCEAVQRALADLVTGPPVELPTPSGDSLTVDFSGVTCICAGPFFAVSRSLTVDDWRTQNDGNPGNLTDPMAATLIEHGVLPELVGRLSVVAAFAGTGPSD